MMTTSDQLIDLISKAGFEANYAGGGEEIVFECPLCDDHKPRLYISRRDFLWICHNCNEKGNIYSFLERILRFDPMKAGHLAKNLLGHAKKREHLEVDRQEIAAELPEMPLPMGFLLLNRTNILERPYWNYLDKRGIEHWVVRDHRMGYAIAGPLASRLIIPVTRDEKRVGWVARDITGTAKRKVLTAPGMKASHALFNLDLVKSAGRNSVGLVEGPFDALTLPTELVSSLGAKISPAQRQLLKEAGISCVTMMWDSDTAGIDGIAKTVPQLLGAGFEVKVAVLPRGEDPNSAGPEAVAEALAQASSVTMSSRFQIRRLVEAKLNSTKGIKN